MFASIAAERFTPRRRQEASKPEPILEVAPLTASAMERLARLTGATQLIPAGHYLVRYGHPFHDLYVVRSGRIQARVVNAVGYGRVLKEFQPGEIIGVRALLRGNYPADFLALEASTICPIPLYMLDELILQRPSKNPAGPLTRLSRLLLAKLA